METKNHGARESDSLKRVMTVFGTRPEEIKDRARGG